jgi:hypothetical protein
MMNDGLLLPDTGRILPVVLSYMQTTDMKQMGEICILKQPVFAI